MLLWPATAIDRLIGLPTPQHAHAHMHVNEHPPHPHPHHAHAQGLDHLPQDERQSEHLLGGQARPPRESQVRADTGMIGGGLGCGGGVVQSGTRAWLGIGDGGDARAMAVLHSRRVHGTD